MKLINLKNQHKKVDVYHVRQQPDPLVLQLQLLVQLDMVHINIQKKVKKEKKLAKDK